ncbi:MAG: carboxypeptidase-like regulatory domain-containing protein, partial [Elusimicrobiales bacterium]|nr:carboxypeptidase-like regulatory domain-containing protein [Elusimicrobiales bacterium]
SVTPSSYAYYSFTPANRPYSDNVADLASENFTRNAVAPSLAWTGEAGYTADGVSPDVEQSSNSFTFRATYQSVTGDSPAAGYPRVLVKKGAAVVQTVPMNFISGDNLAGAVYSTSTLLAPCSFYTYSIEAKDVYNTAATPRTGTGPDVRAFITGAVRDANSAAMGSVTMTLAGGQAGSVLTAADGTFAFNWLPAGSNYTVTPSSYAYYSFTPAARSTAPIVNNISAWDFARDNTGAALAWTGEAGYTADGVEPGVGALEIPFVFRVKYSDAENDAPAAGYPKLHIKKAGAEIAGSPYTMAAADSNAFTAGRVYSYSKTFSAIGNDYSYYIEAKDAQNGATANTAELAGPNVAHQPVLAWTGEAGYTASGISPSTGTAASNYTFRVKYTDMDGLAPAAGFPKVHVYRGGAEIAGGPFTMTYVSGAPNVGAVYTYTATLSTGMAYTYAFEAQNQYLFAASNLGGYGPQVRTKISGYVRDLAAAPMGSVTMTLAGAEAKTYLTAADGYYEFLITTQTYSVTPSSYAYYGFTPANRPYSDNVADLASENFTRNAVAPSLAWTGEAGYTADGVSPDVEQSSNSFTFRATYQSVTGDSPAAGYPRVLVKKGA